MIYLDNASTTLIKPYEVNRNLMDSLNNIGNCARGYNDASLNTSRMIVDTRIKLAKLFNIDDPRRIAFTSNATDSLNIAINGLFNEGDHIISSVCEHNSVLRPLYRLNEKGVDISFIPIIDTSDDKRREGYLDYEALDDLIKENTKAIIITHASNVTGNITDLKKVSRFAKDNGLLLIVDAAQSAGAIEIDVKKYGIDVLCFTGHKSLMGIQGTGGIYVREEIYIDPLRVGGTGIKSYDKYQPKEMPEALEAGTLNGHGIYALNGALEFLLNTGVDNIRKKELDLKTEFIERLKNIPEIKFYGNPDLDKRVGIVSINIGDINSSTISDILANRYHIASRAGAHCAPLMHEALKTVDQGIIRFSFSYFNEATDIKDAADALYEISRKGLS